MQTKAQPELSIRWLIRRDMPEVLQIERGSFEYPWTEEEFLGYLRQCNCIGTVLEEDHCIRAFMIYELHPDRLELVSLAVHPGHRRRGFGTRMVQRLQDKLSIRRRREIATQVRETNVGAQLFLKQMHFRADSVIRDFYESTSEDSYCMRYLLHPNIQTINRGEKLKQGSQNEIS